MDNLRSHVKTVHQGKAGMKLLEPGEDDELNIVTVAADEMVTLATEALAATAVTQLTGERQLGVIHALIFKKITNCLLLMTHNIPCPVYLSMYMCRVHTAVVLCTPFSVHLLSCKVGLKLCGKLREPVVNVP